MNELKIGELNVGGKDDSVTLWANIFVVDSDVLGVGKFVEAVHRRSFAFTLKGKAYATGAGQAKQLFALIGEAFTGAAGAPNVPTLNFSLEGLWGQDGKAEYTVWNDFPTLEHRSGLVHATWR
jgi:hypothetical protein